MMANGIDRLSNVSRDFAIRHVINWCPSALALVRRKSGENTSSLVLAILSHLY